MVTPRSKWINIDVFRPISTILGILLSSPFGLASPSISTGQCRQLVALEESTHLPEAPGPISSVESFIRLTTQSVSDQDPSLRLPKVEIYFSNFPTQRTVAVDNLKALGSGGEGYYLLNRTNDTWRSRSGPNYFAPESDPTWVISALGTRLAGFLGFRLLSESKMVVPNALLFNRRIVALNSLLRKKGFEEIYVRWSPTIEPPSDKITGSYAEEFIRTFYFDKTSPFSDGEIVHDTSHHSFEILLTASQLRPTFARIEMAIEFAKYMRTTISRATGKFPILSQSNNREALLALFFQLLSRDKDNFSGRIPIMILETDTSSAIENSSFFRLMETHLGREFGETFTGQGMFIVFHKKYILADWLEAALFKQLLPWIQQEKTEANGKIDYPLDYEKLFSFTLKRYGPAIKDLQNDPSKLAQELTLAFSDFIKVSKRARTLLASYDENLDIVGGIASPEHPVSSFHRRIRELNLALDP